jgi:hypothetical protein
VEVKYKKPAIGQINATAVIVDDTIENIDE